jgi:SAM-dependent methyltransferase
MWTAEQRANKDRMLQRVEFLKGLPRYDAGTYLHLGCGPQILTHYTNIDKYHKHPEVRNMDMGSLDYPDNSVKAIYSSHSLEHLPFRPARLALREWARVLAPGGALFLAVPDMEECFRAMLRTDIPYETKWNWFVYTIWGYQVDPNAGRSTDLKLPLDPGQFHQCGFSQEFLNKELATCGLAVQTIFAYDGWDTPSIWVEARK